MIYIGHITIPLDDLEPFIEHDSSWVLGEDMNADHDRDADDEKSKKSSPRDTQSKNLGDVRLKLKYTEEKILPENEYKGNY